MSNSQEIKGNLARLLATENLIVEHRKVSTASFDVVRRVLTLPLWQKASNTVYDLLVGHEVGHALYTPVDDWMDEDIPKDFLNVVEDARIEKLMKRKYPGLAKDFYRGYQELNDDDFFGISDEDVSRYNLIDRINLHFKIGAYACIPFEDREKKFLPQIESAETFEEVIAICKELVEFLENNDQQTEKIDLPSEQSSAQSGGSSVGSNANMNDNEGENANEENNLGDSNNSDSNRGSASDIPDNLSGNLGGDSAGDTVSKTQRSFDAATEDLNNHSNWSQEPVYIEVPEVNLEQVIVDHDVIIPYIANYYNNLESERRTYWDDVFQSVDESYLEFKKQAQKEVNYLVKEFECRKSADAYARAGQSKTGVLDTSKLHTFKYNDDLFKKVTVLPDGKNHGMIFILDWSGSMSNVLMDTVKQLLNLCWFCRKVQIPFEVYAFTYEWSNRFVESSGDEEVDDRNYIASHGMITVTNRFHLLNFLTSRCNSKQFEESAKNLWRTASYMDNTVHTSGYYTVPAGVDLSGTPLNESIITLKTLIPFYINQNKLQKLSVCILTDGESNGITHDVDMNIVRGADYIGKNAVNNNCCLRDRKIGKVYRHCDGYSGKDGLTTILIENIKDNFPNVNLVGFRIASGSDFSHLYRDTQEQYNYDEVMKKWRKHKSWEFNKNVGYDSLYVISQTSLSCDTEFDVESGAKTSDIKKAFKNMLKNKTVNKKILTSFATLVS
jgi:hypothetical protein